jgi:hypothetical protein
MLKKKVFLVLIVVLFFSSYVNSVQFVVPNDNTQSLNDLFVPYLGANKDVLLGLYNLNATVITGDRGVFRELNVSNSSIYVGNVKISSSSSGLSVDNNVTSPFFYGSGRFLSDINLSNVNGTSIFNGPVTINGPLTVYDNITANNFFGNISYTYVLGLNNSIDARIITTTYCPWNISVLSGTQTVGNYSDLCYPDEGRSVNISENSGANPDTLLINFSNVDNFNKILLRVFYEGSAGHQIAVGLYDYDTNSYEEEYGFITDMTNFAYISFDVYDSSDHINNGSVSIRLRHIQQGQTSHRLRVDYAVLIKGFNSQTSNEHDSLVSRNNFDTNHPLYAEQFRIINSTKSNLNSNITIDMTNGILIMTNNDNKRAVCFI